MDTSSSFLPSATDKDNLIEIDPRSHLEVADVKHR